MMELRRYQADIEALQARISSSQGMLHESQFFGGLRDELLREAWQNSPEDFVEGTVNTVADVQAAIDRAQDRLEALLNQAIKEHMTGSPTDPPEAPHGRQT